MKRKTHCKMSYSLAAIVLLPATLPAEPFLPADLVAQPLDSFVELAERDAVSSSVQLANEESQLRRQMEQLEAASMRRRVELEQRLQQLTKQRERAKRYKAEYDSERMASLESMLATSDAQPRWIIGLQVAPGTSDGVTVQAVVPGTPAAAAELVENDRIRAVNGIVVRDVKALNAIINAAGAQELELEVHRGDEQLERLVTPSRLKPEPLQPFPLPVPNMGYQYKPAVEPQPLNASPPGVRKLEWREVNPGFARTFPTGPGAGPDTAELQSLKRDIRELRELVAGLAASLVDVDVETEDAEAIADDLEFEDDDEADPAEGARR